MAARVARGRDREEVVREMDGLVAFQRALGRLSERRGVPRVNDAAAAETFPESRVIRHVVLLRLHVAMGQEERRHAAKPLEPGNQGSGRPR